LVYTNNNFNIMDAEAFLDDELSDDQVDFLLAARAGVALHDVPDKVAQVLLEHRLIDIVPFDHPRATNAIKGVIPSERGNKILNVLDDRQRAEDQNGLSTEPVTSDGTNKAVADAQMSSKGKVERVDIPKNDPRNIDPDTNGEKNADQQAKLASGDKRAKSDKDDTDKK